MSCVSVFSIMIINIFKLVMQYVLSFALNIAIKKQLTNKWQDLLRWYNVTNGYVYEVFSHSC